MAEPPFASVGVVGLGLMGGSLARAVKRSTPEVRVVGADADPDATARALADGVIDAADGPPELFASAELVVLATPIGASIELLRAYHGRLRPDALATDLGSVKRPIVAAARELGLDGVFVGGHPMAGHHRHGYTASRADLFTGATVWLTPVRPGGAAGSSEGARVGGAAGGRGADDAPPPHDTVAGVSDPWAASPVAARLASFWRGLGARPLAIEAEAHDGLMAWVSHLPQLAASALGAVLADSGTPRSALGPGGRDATRLAGSAPGLWAEILLANADLLEAPVGALREKLNEFARALAEGDRDALFRLLAGASRWAEG